MKKLPVIGKPLRHENGVLNVFQPVEGGFRFIGTQDDAKQYILHHYALIRELEAKFGDVKVVFRRLFQEVVGIEMLEYMYQAGVRIIERAE